MVLVWMMFCLAFEVQAQTSATGVVKDATGEPLIGVTVAVKGQKGGTVTDFDGNFSVKAKSGDVLVFSYIGYKAQEVKYIGKPLEVTMKDDNALLDEVVVVGYGTMKRSDITGSTVSVTGDELKKTIATSVDQALQGKAAGVAVSTNSGAPGGGISVSIRGTNSLNGNEPLYIIDGIAISGQTDGNSSALSTINPGDIVSMEILKDASATAIYGSRASNGVVIIKTKQGEAGKTRLSYEGYLGIQTIPRFLDMMNLQEFARFYNARVALLGWGERGEFADPNILGPGTDWQHEIFQTALMHNHSVSVSGGHGDTKFAVTGSYTNQDGIAIGTSFNRFTVRANLETKVAKWMAVGLNSSLARYKRENSIENDYDYDGAGVIRTALRQFPEVPVRNPDGSYGVVAQNQTGTYYSNPVADAMMKENYRKGLDASVNVWASIDPLPGLNLRVEYGTNYGYQNRYKYTPVYDYDYFTQASSGERGSSNSRYTSFKTYATYSKKIKEHSVSLMLGHETQDGSYEDLSGSRTGYKFNSVHELPAGDSSTAKNSSSVGEYAIESYFGRLNYNFGERYLLTTTLRADGSSSFGPNNRWGYFPSVALAWRASQESFLKDVAWLSNLKLRLGWGLVGNQGAGNYAYGATMGAVATVWGTGYVQSSYPNDNLKWEKTNSWNVGLDISLFKNRIELIVDAYYKKTDNMLVQATLPSYATGAITAPWVNVGAMENKGFEFTLNTVNITNKDLTWKTGITFSLNRNKVTELYTETATLPGTLDGKLYTMTTVGNPVAQFYGYKVKGLFTTEDDFYAKDKNGDYLLDEKGNKKFVALPTGKTVKENEIWYGDYIWEDLNGDGVIDEQDRTNIGNPHPKFTFGVNNTVSWKDFDLTIFINGSVGNKIYNYLVQENAMPTNNSGMMAICNDYARVELIDATGERTLENMHVTNATTAQVQRITPYNANDNNRQSDRFVENGSYLRVKNIALGYTLPRQWLQKVGIESLRVYCNIQNAFTITGYDGYDPEIGSYNQNVKLTGIDFARYPSQRIYTFCLNVNF